MRKLYLALPGLLALIAAAPASADPVRLDEAGLGGVAAGNVGGLSVVDTTTTTTSTNMLSTVTDTVRQALHGSSSAANHATAVFSTGVTASGPAATNVTGNIIRNGM